MGLKVRVGNHGHLRKIKDGQQFHHLNQDAAFRLKIPREEGAAIKLKGNAFRDIGSDHYNVHKELEKFWDQYRRGGSKFGQVPTIGEYNKALENSLKQTSMSPQERCKALSSAKRNQRRYCLTEDDLVPRIPGRINQKR